MIIKKIFARIKSSWVKRNSKSYIAYLKNQGIQIGDNCISCGACAGTCPVSAPSEE